MPSHSHHASPNRIKVAFVAPSLRILGGQAVQADRLLKEWRTDPEIDAWLAPVNPLPPRPLRFALRIKYLRTILTEAIYIPSLVRHLARADVAHVFSASYSSFLLAPLPAILIARALGKPVVLNYRSGQAPDHLRRSRIARWALARVDRNVVPSRFLVDVFRSFGIAASIIPNIVSADRFAFRERRPLRPRFLSTRNFDALYNVSCTLRAFRLIQDARPDASLTLVGGGPQEASLRTLVAELGLRQVTFAGRVPPGEIPRYYAEHDIYIQSPDIDNMPASIIEAYACGLPVVSTNAGGVPAILTSGVHGLLAPVDDHQALAEHAVRLLSDQALAERLIAAARQVANECTWERVRHDWVRTYRSVLRPAVETSSAALEPAALPAAERRDPSGDGRGCDAA